MSMFGVSYLLEDDSGHLLLEDDQYGCLLLESAPGTLKINNFSNVRVPDGMSTSGPVRPMFSS